MVENGAKIGAVHNIDAFHERVTISGLHVLTKKEAIKQRYQTGEPALVPMMPSRGLTEEQVRSFTTQDADSREHLFFLRFGKRAVSAIKAYKLQPGTCILPKKRPLIELTPGIKAHLTRITYAEAGELTTAKITHGLNPHLENNPNFPEGFYVGVHFDHEGGLPIATRRAAPRRLIVNLGPGPRYSLLVVPDTALDLSEELHPRDPEYVPRQKELLKHLVQKADEPSNGIHVLWTLLEPGEGYVLPSHTVFHNGSTFNQGPSRTAVLYESEKRWTASDLSKYSIF